MDHPGAGRPSAGSLSLPPPSNSPFSSREAWLVLPTAPPVPRRSQPVGRVVSYCEVSLRPVPSEIRDTELLAVRREALMGLRVPQSGRSICLCAKLMQAHQQTLPAYTA